MRFLYVIIIVSLFVSCKNEGINCGQIFFMNALDSFKDGQPLMVSTGKRRTTCSYFLPDGKHFINTSTHLKDRNYLEAPLKKEEKYVWHFYDSFDVFVATLERNITAQLINELSYDAEATVLPKGDKIVFNSIRNSRINNVC